MKKYWYRFLQWLLAMTTDSPYVQVATNHVVNLRVLKVWDSYGDCFPWRAKDEVSHHYLLGYPRDYPDSSTDTLDISTVGNPYPWKVGDFIVLYEAERLIDDKAETDWYRMEKPVTYQHDWNTWYLLQDTDICAL